MSKLQDAISIAVSAHSGQTRYDGSPYILHPMRVMLSVKKFGAATMIVAILHDVIEDNDSYTLNNLTFDSGIIDAIDAITKRENEKYEHYINRIKLNKLATIVKIADLADNINSLEILSIDEKYLKRIAKYHKTYFELIGFLKIEHGETW
jgi:(p)ppGpp synthase/HD superfamily hydrolase